VLGFGSNPDSDWACNSKTNVREETDNELTASSVLKYPRRRLQSRSCTRREPNMGRVRACTHLRHLKAGIPLSSAGGLLHVVTSDNLPADPKPFGRAII
jgi:hypothetical protein